MNIRPAIKSDSTNISRLALDFSAKFKTTDYTDNGWASYERELLPRSVDGKIDSEHFLVLVSEVDEALAGYIILKDHKEILQLFVPNQDQSNGIEEALWNQALKICGQKNEVSHYFVRSQVSLIELYESVGFRSIGQNQWAKGFKFRLMEYGQNES